MNKENENLKHIGIKRRSGRYPWDPSLHPHRSHDFLSKVDEQRLEGLSDKEIAKKMNISLTEFRNQITIANENRKLSLMNSIKSMKEDGKSNNDIAKRLNISEGSVRNYLNKKETVREKQLSNIKKVISESINKDKYLDVGAGVELQLGISREKLRTVISQLKQEGYTEHKIYVRNVTDPSKWTTMKVLSKEKDIEVVKKNSDKIRPVEYHTEDGGITFQGLKPIKHMPWDKISIRYAEQGGEDRDGTIELRKGVKDLDLGGRRYAQVRIGVGETHFMKGMALYSDDIPKGKDIVFNTNKPLGTPKEKVLKELKPNKDNPFGATIKPGGQKGYINIVNEEGDWDKWSGKLSSQFLSKQPINLIKDRLDNQVSLVKKEHAELSSLTNPLIKKFLLNKFSDGLDVEARELKVKGLPRTKSQVILPLPKISPNEIYAPNYNNGEKVVLVRHPHGGIFEIPELTVNNNTPHAKNIKGALDAVGIHPSVAKKLSGADFDGDSVLVMPNNRNQIKSARSLKELKNFDPNMYKVDYKTINNKFKQTQMGIVSNLITDMHLKDATPSEIARAVKHSMVVIDAEKHNLNYKQSAIDNGISALRKKYSAHINPLTGKQAYGASTLISLADATVKVGGEYKEVKDKNGKIKRVLVGAKDEYIQNLVPDIRKLSSGTAKEKLYEKYILDLRHIQKMSLAESNRIPNIKRDPNAAKVYSNEIISLEKKLNQALLNAPKERMAQILATRTYYKNRTPDMDKDQKNKLRQQALAAARVKVGAHSYNIYITENEWKAIQSRAISHNKLMQILNHSDLDRLRKLATPSTNKVLSPSKLLSAKTKLANGYSYAEIANSLGVSPSTIREALKGGK